MKARTIFAVFILAAVSCAALPPTPSASNTNDAPTFTTEQKKEIIALIKDSQALQDRQIAVQKTVNEVCKAPAWQFSNQVPNLEGTGTEPGCIPAPPQPKLPEKK